MIPQVKDTDVRILPVAVTGDAARTYNIVIGSGAMAGIGRLLADALPHAGAQAGARRKVLVVTDKTTGGFYLQKLTDSLTAAAFDVLPPVILPDGEETKQFRYLEKIVTSGIDGGIERGSAVVALGGGVVGDIAGFAASIMLRGLFFVQVPTTLLAQVDSAVGGKTAINLPAGKNLAGSFYPPHLVIADTATLATLSPRERRAGYAEVLKYALINDAAFFAWLEAHGEKLLAGDAAALQYAVETSCQAKAAIVAADLREEKDIRILLNLGHTFGHALETLGGYDGRLLHGEAVACGIAMAFDYAVRAGVCPAGDAARVLTHMQRIGLVTVPPFAVDAAAVFARMRGDKKTRDGRITLVLPRGLGDSFVDRNVNEDDLQGFLCNTIGEWNGK